MRRLIRVLLPAFLLIQSLASVAAQDATPSTPFFADCNAPEVPPGTAVPLVDILARGTVAPEILAAGPRIPTIGDELPAPAPPNASPTIEGEQIDDATADRVIDAVNNLFACLRRNDYLAFALLVTPEYREAAFGTAIPYNAGMVLEGHPDVTLNTVGMVLSHDDGRLSADVMLFFKTTQVYRFRAMFVEDAGQLLLDEEIPLPFDNADVVVSVAIEADRLSAEPVRVPASSSLVAFEVRNGATTEIEVALIRLPKGITEADLAESPSSIDLSAYVGGVLVEPGGIASYANANLSPGQYTLVGIMRSSNGTPTVSPDMIVDIVVG